MNVDGVRTVPIGIGTEMHIQQSLSERVEGDSEHIRAIFMDHEV